MVNFLKQEKKPKNLLFLLNSQIITLHYARFGWKIWWKYLMSQKGRWICCKVACASEPHKQMNLAFANANANVKKKKRHYYNKKSKLSKTYTHIIKKQLHPEGSNQHKWNLVGRLEDTGFQEQQMMIHLAWYGQYLLSYTYGSSVSQYGVGLARRHRMEL